MKIPFGTISITEESKDLVKKILDSSRVSSGKYVREFEERFAKMDDDEWRRWLYTGVTRAEEELLIIG